MTNKQWEGVVSLLKSGLDADTTVMQKIIIKNTLSMLLCSLCFQMESMLSSVDDKLNKN